MRIISGKYKGKRLTAPKKLPVRPTTDMAKEALFNILNNRFYFDELKVLDLFSGTGNISFELASRGTEKITAVDSFPGCVRYISKTASELDFSINTIKSDVYKFLEGTSEQLPIFPNILNFRNTENMGEAFSVFLKKKKNKSRP
jgi:16S rRNA (guanine966-N2)-methyltransferase